MITEFKKTLKPTIIVSCLLSIVFLFVNFKYSISILVGTLFSILHLFKLEKDIDSLLANRVSKGSYFRFMLNMLILMCPFILTVIFPESLDFIGCFIGLVINKVIFYVMNLKRKE